MKQKHFLLIDNFFLNSHDLKYLLFIKKLFDLNEKDFVFVYKNKNLSLLNLSDMALVEIFDSLHLII
ncbi:hypothetical protein BpHYR1_046152 [Brachionus plicatilis]|uniref:Uncharacterized protein n=1 Tax=Brachionus plicatilis TaxID=10195 RepID=A0A3M7P279_BRAPC|nr:hypothetical protein BpHYR1_046152 [Brachionus plicatilis]